MTAEIAILNQEAVALAADSAVTGPKIFTSANKIFSLSKYHPVGVMVYNSAQFIGGVPWETIIKSYRRELGTQSFPTLREQASHFLGYFDRPNNLFPEAAQRESAEAIFAYAVGLVRDAIDDRLQKLLDTKGPLTKRDVSKVTGSIIDDTHKEWLAADVAVPLPEDHDKTVLRSYEAELDSAIDAQFEKLPLTKPRRRKLREIAAARVARGGPDPYSPFHSGVVIAGFGQDDYFPRLYPFDFEAITLNRLKYSAGDPVEIASDNRAVVAPFAQKEQVDTFMTGIDPVLDHRMRNFWSELGSKIVDAATSTPGLSASVQSELVDRLRDRCDELLNEYATGLGGIIQQEYIWPIIKVVAMLPKDELAAMAESLVNLTSFKRKISEQAETVGGPIDVAVISKGDGFIWIKRKHYFTPQLNPHFLANYHREDA